MKNRVVLLLIFILVLASCSSEPEVDIDATVAAGVAATQAAAPLPTAAPTEAPTATPLPEPTATPTEEPEPTATVAPTEEPTPEPEVVEPTEEAVEPSVIKTNRNDGVLYEMVADGFSIELPNEWRSADFDTLQLEEIFDGIADQNEGLSELFSSDYFQGLAAVGVRFYAVNMADPALLAMSPPVINIVVQDLPVEFTLAEYIEVNVTQLGQYFDLTSEIEQRDLMLGDYEASMLQYSANLTDPFGRPLELTNTQYLLLEDATAYVVTVAVPRDTTPEQLATFMESAETFRLLDQP